MTSRRSPRGRLLAAAGGAVVTWMLSTGVAAAHDAHTPAPGSSARGLLRPWLTNVVPATALLLVAGLLLVAIFSGAAAPVRRFSRSARAAFAVAAAIVVAAVAERSYANDPLSLGAVLLVIHLLGVALWVGAVALGLLTWRRPSWRALTKPAVAGAALTVLTGLASTAVHSRGLDDVTLTAFGHGVFVELLLAAFAAILGFVVWRSGSGRRMARVVTVVEGLTLAGAVGVGSLLALLPTPAAALSRGVPVVRRVGTGAGARSAAASVVVTPNRPGQNLVRVFTPGALSSVTIDGVRVDGSAEAAGGWAGIVSLPAGVHSIAVHGREGQAVGAVRFSTAGSPSPLAARSVDDVDDLCLDAQLGAAVAVASGSDVAFPGDCANQEVALAGRAARSLASVLSGDSDAEVVVAGDGSPRAEALETALRRALPTATIRETATDAATGAAPAAAAAPGLPAGTIVDAVVVATGPQDAPIVMRKLGAQSRRGIFLAPWLLSPRALGSRQATDPQATIALPVDPNGPAAQRYLSAMGRALPGAEPSLGGLLGFVPPGRSAVGPASDAADRRMQLFTPADLSILPTALDAGHDHAAGDPNAAKWLPTGRLLPIASAGAPE